MATKSYSKHKEFKEFKTSGNLPPYTDEQFDMMKSELIPKGSKLDSLSRTSNGGAREYHYEYKEEKHPSGKYDRKDYRTVEEYTVPAKMTPKSSESKSYYYEREEKQLPAITSSGTKTYNYESTSSATPGYSRVKNTKVTKDLSHNVDELDSLLDDLQNERQLYKSGYSSDTAESTSFDYRKGTPAKAPSSGYSTLKREERQESNSWGSQRQAELRQETFREEKTESRVVPSQVSPALPLTVPAPLCSHCHVPSSATHVAHSAHSTGTLSRSSTPMNKVTTTVKTYTYEVPAGTEPGSLLGVPGEQNSYRRDEKLISSSNTNLVPPSPSLGCQYCSHCNSSTRHYQHVTSSTEDRTNERMVYPTPANETKVIPVQTQNGHGPYSSQSPATYKYSETTYSAVNSREQAPSPFPHAAPPSPATQRPPRALDELLADFPDARFPTQPDGVSRRRVEVSHESSQLGEAQRKASSNVAGPPVYYPPGHTPFQRKEPQPLAQYQASATQGGGGHASGRGMYEMESGSKSKQKHSESKTAVPVCLPLCCAMPCVIM